MANHRPLTTNTHKAWLHRAGSLTEGLRQIGDLQLEVCRQTVLRPASDERIVMGLPNVAGVQVREVCMSIDGIACVVARSLLTPQGLRGPWKAVGQLGKRPLADLLYHDSKVVRSHFEVARVGGLHPLGTLAKRSITQQHHNRSDAFWARRSVFWRGGQPLLVAECFLPVFWDLVE